MLLSLTAFALTPHTLKPLASYPLPSARLRYPLPPLHQVCVMLLDPAGLALCRISFVQDFNLQDLEACVYACMIGDLELRWHNLYAYLPEYCALGVGEDYPRR
jgi:hypothetical protein